MFLNLRNAIPPWKEDYLLIDEADAWKWKDEIAAAKAVYQQWAEVYAMVALYADSLQSGRKGRKKASEEEDDDDAQDYERRRRYALHHQNGERFGHSLQLPQDDGDGGLGGAQRRSRPRPQEND